MSDSTLRLAQDFRIPPPKGAAAPAAPAPAASQAMQGSAAPMPPTASAPGTGQSMLSFDAFLPKPVSTGELAIAVAVFVLLLVPFFFAKMSVTRGLQSRYAAPGPASEAGWLLFTWLAFTALLLIAGYVSELWSRLPVSVPAAVASLVLLILFLRKRSLALKTRR